MPRPNERVAATLTIKDAAKMTPQGKKDIDNWLRRQGRALMKDGKLYDKNFTARYIYLPKKKTNAKRNA